MMILLKKFAFWSSAFFRVVAIGWSVRILYVFTTADLRVVTTLPFRVPHSGVQVTLEEANQRLNKWLTVGNTLGYYSANITKVALFGLVLLLVWSLVVDFHRRANPGGSTSVFQKFGLFFAHGGSASVLVNLVNHTGGSSTANDVLFSLRFFRGVLFYDSATKRAAYLETYRQTIEETLLRRGLSSPDVKGCFLKFSPGVEERLTDTYLERYLLSELTRSARVTAEGDCTVYLKEALRAAEKLLEKASPPRGFIASVENVGYWILDNPGKVLFTVCFVAGSFVVGSYFLNREATIATAELAKKTATTTATLANEAVQSAAYDKVAGRNLFQLSNTVDLLLDLMEEIPDAQKGPVVKVINELIQDPNGPIQGHLFDFANLVNQNNDLLQSAQALAQDVLTLTGEVASGKTLIEALTDRVAVLEDALRNLE